MKKNQLFILIFVIATSLNIIECSIVNITLKCQVSSCASDKEFYKADCSLPNGLNVSTSTEVAGLDINKNVEGEQITSLEIKSSSMTEFIPIHIGRNFGKLENFEITGSKLRKITKPSFADMTNLKVLNLANNKIENFHENTFDTITNLEILYLYGNHIYYLERHTLNKLTNLREFHVDSNHIERIDDHFFKNNTKIEKISFNDNNLVYFNQNFTKLQNLTYVDLRNNFKFCKACEIMSEKAREERFNDCERERFSSSREMMKKFEECVNKKISEKDEYLKKISNCSVARERKLTEIAATFENCTVVKEHPITIHKVKDIDVCIVKRITSENNENKNFEKCVGREIERNKELKHLVLNCNSNRTIEMNVIKDTYDSCVFCKIMGQLNSIEKCELRYNKDHDDDINEFNLNVKKFFGIR